MTWVRACAQTFLGDALSDLPPISNFTFADAAEYASAPRTPYQAFLRRNPPDREVPN